MRRQTAGDRTPRLAELHRRIRTAAPGGPVRAGLAGLFRERDESEGHGMIDWQHVVNLGGAIIGGIAGVTALYVIALLLMHWSDWMHTRRCTCPHCGKVISE